MSTEGSESPDHLVRQTCWEFPIMMRITSQSSGAYLRAVRLTRYETTSRMIFAETRKHQNAKPKRFTIRTTQA